MQQAEVMGVPKLFGAQMIPPQAIDAEHGAVVFGVCPVVFGLLWSIC